MPEPIFIDSHDNDGQSSLNSMKLAKETLDQDMREDLYDAQNEALHS